MSVTFCGWVCDTLTPWMGQNSAELISRVTKHKTFVVHVLDSKNRELTDIKVQLFVKRFSEQEPFKVYETSKKEFYTGYILKYEWSYWPSDEDNFSFTLKATRDEKVLSETTLLLESTRRSERIGTNLRLKPTDKATCAD